MKKTMWIIAAALCVLPTYAGAQQVLTLDECRQMAVENNNSLKTAQQKIKVAGYDRNIALANYFPKITATGTYMYTSRDWKLIDDDKAAEIQNAGTTLQNDVTNKMMQIMSDKDVMTKYMTDAAFKKLIDGLQTTDIATPINAIGQHITDALTLDMHNLCGAVVSVQQPVFMGGKIVASNQMAKYAEELAKSQYDAEHAQVLADIEQAYWQIVSIAAKKNLAENYADLLRQMGKDVDALVAEGFATPSDALTIKVKMNEAEMLYTKATNGLALAKMLLCKECGLPLDSEITLADETLDAIPVPQMSPVISDEEVYAARPEIKSLDLAKKIYDKKVAVVRADGLPTVAVMANYAVTNPNVFNGFQNKFGGFFSAGVLVNVPIFHGTEAIQKTRKAKAEAALTQYRLDDAKEMISLQVAQLRQQEGEALEKLTMAESNLENAEENLRVATAGWNEGMIASNVVLQAQTAWLQAHSEYIETGVELQMCAVNLAKAEGRL
ncbi:MAG: TolC family protein [Candidatus Cryptobacteroides sp.]|mgnify:FL=1|nr:TolC family protein [Bacteroidales bacterium]MDD7134422.1 TolC family protein [Bacteroidales bacterium]MDY2773949.1 TolC family protein [Candidatus Cryptobacteroides sp.]